MKSTTIHYDKFQIVMYSSSSSQCYRSAISFSSFYSHLSFAIATLTWAASVLLLCLRTSIIVPRLETQEVWCGEDKLLDKMIIDYLFIIKWWRDQNLYSDAFSILYFGVCKFIGINGSQSFITKTILFGRVLKKNEMNLLGRVYWYIFLSYKRKFERTFVFWRISRSEAGQHTLLRWRKFGFKPIVSLFLICCATIRNWVNRFEGSILF